MELRLPSRFMVMYQCFDGFIRVKGLEVKRLGGLHVIGTSLHESRRIDNQLRGRRKIRKAMRSWINTVHGQDEMFQKFNFDTEWAVKLISRITNDEDVPIKGDTNCPTGKLWFLEAKLSLSHVFGLVRSNKVQA
ncbi:hypothetical protein L2E82_08160 [Cichorium intybus]|uniref:Uncharacterized protein n=1 Tax=Cichorium intybus TaxID=13427 RepID=A0ACB9G6D9_CICIN|nr:hypothetical protein L2E82_08160 [Cichorium intybus]